MIAGHQAKRRADEIAGETLREAESPVATHADDNGAPASASVSHRLLFSADARVATSTTPEDGKGVKDSDAEHDDENSASFQGQDEDEADSDSNASRGRSDDEENAGETLGEAECSVATHVEENGAAMAV